MAINHSGTRQALVRIGRDLNERFISFLFNYRLTPVSGRWKSISRLPIEWLILCIVFDLWASEFGRIELEFRHPIWSPHPRPCEMPPPQLHCCCDPYWKLSAIDFWQNFWLVILFEQLYCKRICNLSATQSLGGICRALPGAGGGGATRKECALDMPWELSLGFARKLGCIIE